MWGSAQFFRMILKGRYCAHLRNTLPFWFNPKFLAKQRENIDTENNERKKFNFKKGKKRFKNRNRPKSFKFKKHSRRGGNRAY